MDSRIWRLRVKSNRSTFLIPSSFYLCHPDIVQLRNGITPKKFIAKALKGVQGEGNKHYIRRVILDDEKKALKSHRLHFNRFEVGILLNIYYTLTNYEVRDMKKLELTNFLYLTLDIINTTSLQGLYRASVKMFREHFAPLSYFNSLVFVRLMSVILRGSIDERATLSFYILDENDDGMVTQKIEIAHSLQSTFDPAVAASAPEIDPDEPNRDTLRYLTKKMGISIDKGLNLEEFVSECLVSPWLIDGILPNLPSEKFNYLFQCFISQVPQLPPIENKAARNRSIVSIKKRKWKSK